MHMMPLHRGRYVARSAQSIGDIETILALRAQCFRSDVPPEQDSFDARSTHILIEDSHDGALVCCYRLLELDGARLSESYAAQYYDLSALTHFEGVMLELGRFCVAPDRQDPEIVRTGWAALTEYVDTHDVKLLFGCSSFSGVEAEPYLDAFAMLRARHLAPKRWLPQIKAGDVFRYAARLRRKPDAKKAWLKMPPLLRSYLMMGGWVSDHAVVDHQMNTLHVFTGLEIAAIPDGRKRLLRALV